MLSEIRLPPTNTYRRICTQEHMYAQAHVCTLNMHYFRGWQQEYSVLPKIYLVLYAWSLYRKLLVRALVEGLKRGRMFQESALKMIKMNCLTDTVDLLLCIANRQQQISQVPSSLICFVNLLGLSLLSTEQNLFCNIWKFTPYLGCPLLISGVLYAPQG